MHSLNPYTYLGLQDNFLFPNNLDGTEFPNPARLGPSQRGNGPPPPPGPPDDGPNIPGRQGDGPPFHNNHRQQGTFPLSYYINIPNQHNSTDSNIKIMNRFEQLQKFTTLNKP